MAFQPGLGPAAARTRLDDGENLLAQHGVFAGLKRVQVGVVQEIEGARKQRVQPAITARLGQRIQDHRAFTG
jgi:hypothetical protein